MVALAACMRPGEHMRSALIRIVRRASVVSDSFSRAAACPVAHAHLGLSLVVMALYVTRSAMHGPFLFWSLHAAGRRSARSSLARQCFPLVDTEAARALRYARGPPVCIPSLNNISIWADSVLERSVPEANGTQFVRSYATKVGSDDWSTPEPWSLQRHSIVEPQQFHAVH